MSHSESDEDSAGDGKFVIKVFVGVFALFLTYSVILLTIWIGWGKPWERIGQLGDAYGMLNSVFSGLAFAGVIITLWLQRKELKLQRKELRSNVEALRAQKEVMEHSFKLQHQPLITVEVLNIQYVTRESQGPCGHHVKVFFDNASPYPAIACELFVRIHNDEWFAANRYSKDSVVAQDIREVNDPGTVAQNKSRFADIVAVDKLSSADARERKADYKEASMALIWLYKNSTGAYFKCSREYSLNDERDDLNLAFSKVEEELFDVMVISEDQYNWERENLLRESNSSWATPKTG